MKIITFLGTIGGNKSAKYKFDENLSKFYTLKSENYSNMFPLLVDNFTSQDNEIIPIFTKNSKNAQEDVLKGKFGGDFAFKFDDKNCIEQENNFYEILRIINSAIGDDNGEYIIDLTHGFRHIPILATISIIAKNLSKNTNIKHIFFAKEVNQYTEYEIIDLKEYLELANMSYMLEMFNQNYTVSNIKFNSEQFQELADELRIFSNHILSNSLKALDAYFDKILDNINNIRKNDQILTFETSLDDIEAHIKKLQNISKMQMHVKLYEMAKILSKKGYLLNSITLLFEAVGYRCVEMLKTLDPKFASVITNFENDIKDGYERTYELIHPARTIVKRFYNKKPLRELSCLTTDSNEILQLHNIIMQQIKHKFPNIQAISNFIKEIENLRNNLAHANGDDKIENSKSKLYDLQNRYDQL
ncbi:MAG: CRISPR-associated DxTHG motif protein, partial [Campylobacter sp.]|nr:CRISPR-associated DxTHG motif protein [Campylobacter sp.]